MPSYFFGGSHNGTRLDWESEERVKVVYKDFNGKKHRRVGKIRRVEGLMALIEFKNQSVCTWFFLDNLRKTLQPPKCENAENHRPGNICVYCRNN